MKESLLIFFSFFLLSVVFCENSIFFSYDENGNRIGREAITLRSVKAVSDNKDEHPLVFSISDTKISAYPNPTESQVNIVLSKNIERGNIFVCDFLGKTIFSQQFSGTNHILDFSNYNSGKYILTVKIGNTSNEIIIIKE